ncbi:hypothetical protein GQ54DRAFT_322361 [Martensiomyces pterosporus]|nr:hypothetical protein GQ54DRAFT_322361 [Martensiomyces pterosporus]
MSPLLSPYLSSVINLHAAAWYPYVLPFLNTLIMAFLDQLPLDILLAVVKWFKRDNWDKLEFCKLLPVTSVNTSLRQSLIPLLYRDLVFDFPVSDSNDDELSEPESNTLPKLTIRTRHNAALAISAGCSECVQRVSLVVNEYTTPDDIVMAVRDDMDAGSETKWPNLCSYAYIYLHVHLGAEYPFSCSDVIRRLDKELPKLRQASTVTCEVSFGVAPLTYNPPSVSFLTQLTSLRLSCDKEGINTNHLPQLFAPTLVDLTLSSITPDNVWKAFYDGYEDQTVVFARLKYLDVTFESPFRLIYRDGLLPQLQGATVGMLTKKSVWTTGGASGKPGCRVPLFPVLRTLKYTNMAYNFHDFISRTQCHNSLVSLCVGNEYVYFDFDAELFKNLETVEFSTHFLDTDERKTGSVDLYKSAFTSLLRAKTNLQTMTFESRAHDTLFQVPPDIGCTNLRSLLLGVEVDLKSMLRLLSNLKHLVELKLDGNYDPIYMLFSDQEDTDEYIDGHQLLQAEYPPVSRTLRRFTYCLYNPKVRCFYTAAYAFELALHLPTLENMTLGVFHEAEVVFYKTLLGKFLEELSGSPYMNDGLTNAKVVARYST